jgi:hypothetical protein
MQELLVVGTAEDGHVTSCFSPLQSLYLPRLEY